MYRKLHSKSLALAFALACASLSGQAVGQSGYYPPRDSYPSRSYDPYDRYDDADRYGDDRYDDDRYDQRDRYSRYDRYNRHDTRYEDRRYSDRILHDRVHDALYRSLGPSAQGIVVRVSYGNVYLSGRVHSWRERERAHDVAHNVRGVHRVFHDRLRAGYW